MSAKTFLANGGAVASSHFIHRTSRQATHVFCFTQRKPSSKDPQSFNKNINGQLNAVRLETSFTQL
jgi:hypothetical protein